jgi:hypothetical protein
LKFGRSQQQAGDRIFIVGLHLVHDGVVRLPGYVTGQQAAF